MVKVIERLSNVKLKTNNKSMLRKEKQMARHSGE
jgi:hypothetical protein